MTSSLQWQANDLPDNQSSISERLQLLKKNETEWKKRIEDKDVDEFTVSGKLKQAGKVSPDEANTTPQTKLKRSGSNRKPRPGSFRSNQLLIIEFLRNYFSGKEITDIT